jgi:hypothetical protein
VSIKVISFNKHVHFLIFFFYLLIIVDGAEVILSLVVSGLGQLHLGHRLFCAFAILQRRLVRWSILLFQYQEVFTCGSFFTLKEIWVVALRQYLEALHRNGPIVLTKKLVRQGFGIDPIRGGFHSLVCTYWVLDIECHKCLKVLLKERVAFLLLRLHDILNYNIYLFYFFYY